mgnify:CR=1 FL=1
MLYFVPIGLSSNIKLGRFGDVTGVLPILILPLCTDINAWELKKVKISDYMVFGGLPIRKYNVITNETIIINARPLIISGYVPEKHIQEFEAIKVNPFCNVYVEKFYRCAEVYKYVYPLCCEELKYCNKIICYCEKCFGKAKPVGDAVTKIFNIYSKEFVNLVKPVMEFQKFVFESYELVEVSHRLASRISRELEADIIVQVGLNGRIRIYVPLSLKDKIKEVVDIIDVVYDVYKTDIYLINDNYIREVFNYVDRNLVNG